MAEGSNKKTLIIVLAVVGVLILCCCGTAVLLVLLGIIAEPETVINDIGSGITGEPIAQPAPAPVDEPAGGEVIDSPDLVFELERVVDRFYPGYEAQSWTLVEGDDTQAQFHIVAVTDQPSGLRILFEADRTGGDNSGYAPDETEFLHAESGALWYHDTPPAGLQTWAGPSAFSPHDEVGAPFLELHSGDGLLITDYGMISNVQVRISGIHESELNGWDGMSTTWESVWDNDIVNSRWVESDFTG